MENNIFVGFYTKIL